MFHTLWIHRSYANFDFNRCVQFSQKEVFTKFLIVPAPLGGGGGGIYPPPPPPPPSPPLFPLLLFGKPCFTQGDVCRKMRSMFLSIVEKYFSVEVTHNFRIALMNNTQPKRFSVGFIHFKYCF